MKQKQQSNFTLIELLIVVAIIAILMAMLLPSLRKARNKAVETACKNNIKQLGLTIDYYRADYDGWIRAQGNSLDLQLSYTSTYPETLYRYLPQYTPNNDIFKCPANPFFSGARFGYFIVGPSSSWIKTIAKPSYKPLISDRIEAPEMPGWSGSYYAYQNNHYPMHHSNGVNVLYADGHARWYIASDKNNLLRFPIDGGWPTTPRRLVPVGCYRGGSWR